MPAKRGMIRGLVVINLSKGSAGNPLSISPDLWYGVSDKFTLGLVHSFVGETGIVGIPGTSLCFGDQCSDVYNGFGIDGRYTLKSSKSLALAFDGGLIAKNLSPFQLALKVGVTGRFRASSKLAIEFSPNLFFGITKREVAMTAGNKETLTVPLTAIYAATPKVGLMVQLGLILPFSNTGDFYLIPVSLGGTFAVNKQLSLEAAFSLPAISGGGTVTGFDFRTFTLGGGYAF